MMTSFTDSRSDNNNGNKDVSKGDDARVNALEWTLSSRVDTATCKDWLELIDAINSSSILEENEKFDKIIYTFERAVRALPFSFKIWWKYITYCTVNLTSAIDQLEHTDKKEVVQCNQSNEWFQWVRNLHIRALEQLPQMPLLWTSYLRFIIDFPLKRFTMTRHVIYDALHALPVTQHRLIWNVVQQWIKEDSNGTQYNTNHSNRVKCSIPHETVRALEHLHLCYKTSLRSARSYFQLLQQRCDFDGFLCECYAVFTSLSSTIPVDINMDQEDNPSEEEQWKHEQQHGKWWFEQTIRVKGNNGSIDTMNRIEINDENSNRLVTFRWSRELADMLCDDAHFWEMFASVVQTCHWHCSLPLELLQRMLNLIEHRTETNFTFDLYQVQCLFALFMCGQGYIHEARNTLHTLLMKAPNPVAFNKVYHVAVEMEDALLTSFATSEVCSHHSTLHSSSHVMTESDNNKEICGRIAQNVFNIHDHHHHSENNNSNIITLNQSTPLRHLEWLVNVHDLLLNQAQLQNAATSVGLWIKRVELFDEKMYNHYATCINSANDGDRAKRNFLSTTPLEYVSDGETTQESKHVEWSKMMSDRVDLLRQAIAQCVTGMHVVENEVGELYSMLAMTLIESSKLNDAMKLLHSTAWHIPFRSSSVNVYLLGLYIELLMLTRTNSHIANIRNTTSNDNDNEYYYVEGTDMSAELRPNTLEYLCNMILKAGWYHFLPVEGKSTDRSAFSNENTITIKEGYEISSVNNAADKIEYWQTSRVHVKTFAGKARSQNKKNGLLATEAPLFYIVDDPRVWMLAFDLCVYYRKFNLLIELVKVYTGAVLHSDKATTPCARRRFGKEFVSFKYAAEAICQATFYLFRRAVNSVCNIGDNERTNCVRERQELAVKLLHTSLNELANDDSFKGVMSNPYKKEGQSSVVRRSFVFLLSQYMSSLLLMYTKRLSLPMQLQCKKMTHCAITTCFANEPVSIIELSFAFVALTLRLGRQCDAIHILEVLVRTMISAWSFMEERSVSNSEITERSAGETLSQEKERKIVHGVIESVLNIKFEYSGIESVRKWCASLLTGLRDAELIQYISLHWAAIEKRTNNLSRVHTLLNACAESQNPHTSWGSTFWALWESSCNSLDEFRNVARRKDQVATLFSRIEEHNNQKKVN